MKKTKSPWRDLYIQLLSDGPRDPSSLSSGDRQLQRELVSELIDGKFANGSVRRDANGAIAGFNWIGPTTEGRLLADRLSEERRQESFGHLVKHLGIGFAGWLGGILSALIVWWLTK